jgi:hypothetical protein
MTVMVPRRTDQRRVAIRVENGRAYLLEPDGSTVAGILFVGEVVPD